MIIATAQFLLSLSILIVLHELGHFGAAKWFKTKVEKFYLFFNPGFSLYKKQIGETEYGIGWLPLGGYVKISGMIDESFDTEQMDREPQPWEFRSKPAWQRLIIMVGGVFINFVLGVFLFIMILWHWGQEYILNADLTDGIAVSELASELGLQDGDQILKVGSSDFVKFSSGELIKGLVIDQAETITVRREGREQNVTVSPEAVAQLTKFENRKVQLMAPRAPYLISNVADNSGGAKAGIETGDRIVSVNGTATPYTHQFLKATSSYEKDAVINVTVNRNGRQLEKTVTLKDGKIGLQGTLFPTRMQKYSLGEAIPAGWNRSIGFIKDQVISFGLMFSGKIKATESLGSFISIGSMFGTEWVWQRFWVMTATLSLLLGFINLLPIPALDGGYVMFLLVEMISGRKIPDRFMEIATFIGFLLLMTLMVFAFGLDISRHLPW